MLAFVRIVCATYRHLMDTLYYIITLLVDLWYGVEVTQINLIAL